MVAILGRRIERGSYFGHEPGLYPGFLDRKIAWGPDGSVMTAESEQPFTSSGTLVASQRPPKRRAQPAATNISEIRKVAVSILTRLLEVAG
jgi:hypothetical protein